MSETLTPVPGSMMLTRVVAGLLQNAVNGQLAAGARIGGVESGTSVWLVALDPTSRARGLRALTP